MEKTISRNETNIKKCRKEFEKIKKSSASPEIKLKQLNAVLEKLDKLEKSNADLMRKTSMFK